MAVTLVRLAWAKYLDNLTERPLATKVRERTTSEGLLSEAVGLAPGRGLEPVSAASTVLDLVAGCWWCAC